MKGSRDASKLLSQHAGCTVARVQVQVLVLVQCASRSSASLVPA